MLQQDAPLVFKHDKPWRMTRENRSVGLVYLICLVCLVEASRSDRPDQPWSVSLADAGARDHIVFLWESMTSLAYCLHSHAVRIYACI